MTIWTVGDAIETQVTEKRIWFIQYCYLYKFTYSLMILCLLLLLTHDHLKKKEGKRMKIKSVAHVVCGHEQLTNNIAVECLSVYDSSLSLAEQEPFVFGASEWTLKGNLETEPPPAMFRSPRYTWPNPCTVIDTIKYAWLESHSSFAWICIALQRLAHTPRLKYGSWYVKLLLPFSSVKLRQ